MNQGKKIMRNTTFLFIANSISVGLFFFLLIIIARTLGPSGLGKYSFALAIAAVLGTIMELGINTLATREVARSKKSATKYLYSSLFVRIIISAIILLVLFLTLGFFNLDLEITTAIFLLAIYMAFRTLSSSFSAIFRAFERMEFEALLIALSTIIIFSLAIILLYLGFGLIGVFLAFVIGGGIELMLNSFIMFTKFIKPKIEFDFKFLKKLILNAIPFGIMGLLVAIYISTDIVMISFLRGEIEVGWYNAAYRFLIAPHLIFIPFITALYPSISKQFTKLQLIHYFLFVQLFPFFPL